MQCSQEIINDDYKYCIDFDLEQFFDTVNQRKLVQLLSDTIRDGCVVSFVHKYLWAGVMRDCKFEGTGHQESDETWHRQMAGVEIGEQT